jgi:hypothetical protein
MSPPAKLTVVSGVPLVLSGAVAFGPSLLLDVAGL